MVHALKEIHRILVPQGTLIDLRPIEDSWPVEIVSGTEVHAAAHLTDLPAALADDQAAGEAVHEAASQGWYAKSMEAEFRFDYYWDTPSELDEFLKTEWEGFEKLEEQALQDVKSAWAVAEGDARIRIRVKMLITRWGKKVGLPPEVDFL